MTSPLQYLNSKNLGQVWQIFSVQLRLKLHIEYSIQSYLLGENFQILQRSLAELILGTY